MTAPKVAGLPPPPCAQVLNDTQDWASRSPDEYHLPQPEFWFTIQCA